MTPLPRLRASRLVARSTEALRERIIAGAFGSEGELPAQGELCRQLGVSRSVIREAMQKLESQGLIAVSQGRPARVRPAGAAAAADSLGILLRRGHASVAHLMEVRRAVETEIAALAAGRAAREGLAALRASLSALSAARDLESRVTADVAFHRALAVMTGNPIFLLVLDVLAELLRNSRRTTIGLGGIKRAHAGHLEILRAVERRDPEGARQAMLRHLAAAQKDLELAAAEA